MVQALAKGDRGETAVETLTEVGVDVIVPWAASRSVTRWSAERAPKALGALAVRGTGVGQAVPACSVAGGPRSGLDR